jgi:hypothetical protein
MIFGLLQLMGLNLVANPPARMTAFKGFTVKPQPYIQAACNKTIS